MFGWPRLTTQLVDEQVAVIAPLQQLFLPIARIGICQFACRFPKKTDAVVLVEILRLNGVHILLHAPEERGFAGAYGAVKEQPFVVVKMQNVPRVIPPYPREH